MTQTPTIRRLSAADIADHMEALGTVLIACVEGGASVGFMPPMDHDKAAAFWSGVAEAVGRGERLVLAAETAAGIVGTVALVLAQPENQTHRADLSKMLVHPRARRNGIGQRLLQAAEDAARRAGKTLLVLDTVAGQAGDRLYTRAGWTAVGDIPDYALYPDGRMCATRIFYKPLRCSER